MVPGCDGLKRLAVLDGCGGTAARDNRVAQPDGRVLDVPVQQTMEVDVVPVLGLPVRQNMQAHDRTPRPVLEQSLLDRIQQRPDS